MRSVPRQATQPVVDPEHDLGRRPGFLLRKAHQVAVAIFFEEVGAVSLTPPQHNVLAAVQAYPSSHQTALSRIVGYDRATVGAVLAGLEARALVRRAGASNDRRLKTIRITPKGAALLRASAAAMERINRRIVECLEPHERAQFIGMLAKIAFSGASGG
jgi:MarR family transcriptional regulator, lower aerobic nicotinate degradation pathway regulator